MLLSQRVPDLLRAGLLLHEPREGIQKAEKLPLDCGMCENPDL
jgi:hypothetical protein